MRVSAEDRRSISGTISGRRRIECEVVGRSLSLSRVRSLSESRSWSLSFEEVESLRVDREDGLERSFVRGLSRSSRSLSLRRLLDSELLGMASVGQLD
jgi:hypothetical protein